MKKLTTLLASLVLVAGMATNVLAAYKPVKYALVPYQDPMYSAKQFEGQLQEFKLRDDRKGESRVFVDIRTEFERNNNDPVYSAFTFRVPYLTKDVQHDNVPVSGEGGFAYDFLDYPNGDSYVLAQRFIGYLTYQKNPVDLTRGDYYLAMCRMIQEFDPNVRVRQIIPGFIENHAFVAYAINSKENKAYVVACNYETIALVGYTNTKKTLTKNQMTDFINRTLSGIGIESYNGKKFLTKANNGRVQAYNISIYESEIDRFTKLK
jgi:hypothetical protein